MKILTTSTGTQTLSIIPRFYAPTINYKIVNEESKVEVDVTGIATTTTLGFLTFDSTYSLNEDTYYELWVYNNANGEIIYRDKIFCTDQIGIIDGVYVEDVYEAGIYENGGTSTYYQINNNEYVEDVTYDNEYLIYGD